MSTQSIIGYGRDGAEAEISQPAVRTALNAAALTLRQMLGRYIHERALRRAENELMRLDDRMLNDIGLARSEISSAVRNPAGERLNGAQPLASEA